MSEANKVQNERPGSMVGSENKGIGFGLFLLLAGLVMLAERLEWLPQRLDWLFPVILIAWGASEIFRRFKSD